MPQNEIMRIIVTTDGSSRSFSVLPHVKVFAAATGSDLILLRVLDPDTDAKRRPGVAAHRSVAPVVDEWTEHLNTTLDSFSVDGEPMVSVIRKGEGVHDAILRVADEVGAGMIAISSRGSGMVRRAVLGSVATRVLGCSRLPIFVGGPLIEEPRRYRQYRILATSDGSPASRQVLDAISPFLKSGTISVDLLRVYVSTFADREERVELAECRREIRALRGELAPGLQVRSHVCPLRGIGTVEGEILERAEQLRVRSIAMSTHGHSARHHLLAGSKALGVLARAPVPVILARSEPAAGCQ